MYICTCPDTKCMQKKFSKDDVVLHLKMMNSYGASMAEHVAVKVGPTFRIGKPSFDTEHKNTMQSVTTELTIVGG